eukprot:SAG25_NODE_130_length_14421_cov_71.473886_16_plen_234_part_00
MDSAPVTGAATCCPASTRAASSCGSAPSTWRRSWPRCRPARWGRERAVSIVCTARCWLRFPYVTPVLCQEISRVETARQGASGARPGLRPRSARPGRAAARGGGRLPGLQPRGAAAAASLLAAVLTEIYRCNVCSCHEILRRHGRGQVLEQLTLPNAVAALCAAGELRYAALCAARSAGESTQPASHRTRGRWRRGGGVGALTQGGHRRWGRWRHGHHSRRADVPTFSAAVLF